MTRLLTALLLLPAAALAGTATVTLDDADTLQTIRGWECTIYIAEPCTPHFDALRDTILTLSVDDVGINRVRLEIRSGVENTTDHYAGWIAAPKRGIDNRPGDFEYVKVMA